jgi:hypothetical protein
VQLPAFFVNGAGELMKANRRRTADYRALILPTEGAFFKQTIVSRTLHMLFQSPGCSCWGKIFLLRIRVPVQDMQSS